jgi:carbon-monoxide dehydrogenase medium subunit
MYTAPFTYHAPQSLRAAVRLLRAHPGEARPLAGGMSLVPAMRLRLAQPEHLVDLGRIGELAGIGAVDGGIGVGAMTAHRDVERSHLLARRLPLLAHVAGTVGDRQVRNRGTLGGSLAHADPAADLPAAVLALEGVLHTAGAGRARRIAAHRFFLDPYTTALGESELLTRIVFPAQPRNTGWAYEKLENHASRFAVVGVAALVTPGRGGACARARIAVTGAGPVAFRARAAERSLEGRPLTGQAIARAARAAGRGVAFLADAHGSAAYREHLTAVLTERALRAASERAGVPL